MYWDKKGNKKKRAGTQNKQEKVGGRKPQFLKKKGAKTG